MNWPYLRRSLHVCAEAPDLRIVFNDHDVAIPSLSGLPPMVCCPFCGRALRDMTRTRNERYRARAHVAQPEECAATAVEMMRRLIRPGWPSEGIISHFGVSAGVRGLGITMAPYNGRLRVIMDQSGWGRPAALHRARIKAVAAALTCGIRDMWNGRDGASGIAAVLDRSAPESLIVAVDNYRRQADVFRPTEAEKGTGLKYVIAVMVRLGAEPVLWRGDDKYTFFRRPVDFRDSSFDLIGYRHERFFSLQNPETELPFTTQLGATWEAWQAYRELEANTRDEAGETFVVEDGEVFPEAEPGYTMVVVDHPAMLDAHAKRDEIFLPESLMPAAETGPSVRHATVASNHLYYRGLRVADIQKPSLMTWNLVAYQELTEDRTLKYEYLARTAVAEHVAASDDESLISVVLGAPPERWEHDLVFDYAKAPSSAFRAVMGRRGGKVTESASRYYAPYVAAPEPAELDVFERYPRPWKLVDVEWINDALDHEILLTSVAVPMEDRKTLLAAVVRVVNEAGR